MKLSSKEKELVNSKYYDLTEDDKLKRKNILYKIKENTEKKNIKNKKKQKRVKIINDADKILLSKNKSNKEKQYTCRKVGLYLINNGKEKLGLEYISECVKYGERIYGTSHHRVLSDYNFYNKLCNRIDIILKARRNINNQDN